MHYNTSAQAAEEVVAEIAAEGGRAVALRAELSDEAQVAALVPDAAAALGPLGCLINNASAFENDTIETADRASWDRHMEPNLRAPFVLTQAFARALPDTAGGAAGGAVINLLDERVWNLTPWFLSYTLSKAGLWTLTQTLAMALAPRSSGQRHRPGPGTAEPAPDARAVRAPVRRDAARPRHHAG